MDKVPCGGHIRPPGSTRGQSAREPPLPPTVARMERSVILDRLIPDCVALDPGDEAVHTRTGAWSPFWRPDHMTCYDARNVS
jgi:hypothetical protein